MSLVVNEIKDADLKRFLLFAHKAAGIDYKKQYANIVKDMAAIKNKSQDYSEDRIRCETIWYESLNNSKPDYSVYDDEYYIAESWLCWIMYSRKYIKELDKWGISKLGIKKIFDLGCGLGLTSRYFKELLPEVEIVGTNFPGSIQYKIASKLAKRHGFKLQAELQEQDSPDLVFASEYFEHHIEPIRHLKSILKTKPKYLVIANTFTGKAIGHFNEYKYDNKIVKNKEISKIFNDSLRDSNYKSLETGFWNNKPAIWRLKNHA